MNFGCMSVNADVSNGGLGDIKESPKTLGLVEKILDYFVILPP